MTRMLLVSLALVASSVPVAAQSEFEKRWKSRVAAFERENPRLDPAVRHVVLFGSSSMEGWKSGKRIERFLPEVAPRILNRGISGDGIGIHPRTGLYNRLEASVTDADPSHVFVLNGRNSVGGYGAPRVAARYREVLRALRRALPQAVVCVVTCAPVRGKNATIKQKTADLNTQLRIIAKEEGCWLIDLHPRLVDDQGLMRANLTSDGLHFKDEGYRILGEEIQRVVRQSERSEPEALPLPQPAAQPKPQPAAGSSAGGAVASGARAGASAPDASTCPAPSSTPAPPIQKKEGLLERLLRRLRGLRRD